MNIVYKITEIDQLIEEVNNDTHCEVFGLVADKLRSIYVAGGWTHMTQEFHRANELVKELTESALVNFKDSNKETYSESAGLRVVVSDDDGTIDISYLFVLI